MTKRTFMVGEEWLYYKLYLGTKTADLILTELIKPVSEKLQKDEVIDQWFFIRYGDPENHLRVRFHSKKEDFYGKVIQEMQHFLQDYVSEGLIWKVQIDTYQRELERYGNDTIQEAEALFHYDSQMMVDFLDLIDGAEEEELRWLFAIQSVDQLLEDFSFEEGRKLALMEHLKTGFGYEFGIDKKMKLQLDKKFRAEQEKIDWFMNLSLQKFPEYRPITEVLERKSNQSQPVINKLIQKTDPGDLSDRVISLIHMQLNRLFRSKNRMHELVVYYFMFKYYKIQVARKKYNKMDLRA